eukprot:511367-Pelagomonas_calceolata.AAC.1
MIINESNTFPPPSCAFAAHLPPANPAITTVVLETLHGTIRIHLEPSWSEESVAYLRHLAANPELCTPACEFYRAEP